MKNMDDFLKIDFLNLNNIIYSDTDSIICEINEIKGFDDKNHEYLTKYIGDTINKEIEKYYKNMLKKLNVNSDIYYNINFKVEKLISSILIIGKKTYAYNTIFEEKKSGSVYYEKPKMTIKGLTFIKTDSSKFIQDFGNEILKIGLSDNNKDFIKENVNTTIKKYKEIYNNSIENFDLSYIGKPQKFINNKSVILGCKLYNILINSNEENISYGQSIYKLPIVINNITLLSNKTKINLNSLKKIKYLCIPYNYDINKIKIICNDYGFNIINEFSICKNERRERIFYVNVISTNKSKDNNRTPIKKIIDLLLQ